MWAGGMMFPRIVVQKEACRILDLTSGSGIKDIRTRILCSKFW